MASVVPPAPTYTPNLPKEIVESGALSLAQLEAVIYAGQAHQEILPNGERRGYLIGDGTGVGKGREIVAIIMDNMRQGRRKSVWISENQRLLVDATRDVHDLKLAAKLHQLKGGYDALTLRDGILFTSYGMLRSAQSEKKREPGKEPRKRLDQIVNWLGPDFDGVIVFDEAHNMANAQESKGTRGNKKPSMAALAGLDLQKRLPKARIVYVSATAATEVRNLAYGQRLGLWGEKTPFANAKDFVDRITTAGVAAMEVVARDMKALGAYIARSLSFDGVKYDRIIHELTETQTAAYNVAADAWQVVLNNLNAVLEKTNQDKSGMAKGSAMAQFWGAEQRFFNQLMTAMQMPSVVDAARKDLKAGHAVVMQLVNTNEAEQERRAAQLEEAGEDEGDIGMEFGPMDGLIGYVETAFPTIQYVASADSEGNVIYEVAKDSNGNAVQSREAIAIRDKLVKDLKAIAESQAIPGNPLDLIIEEFGTDLVAEATGRGRRFVRKKKGDAVVMEEQRRGDNAVKADVSAFQADRKRVLIFSQAAGTGVSFHADLATAKNLRLRRHYLVQAGWRADKAMQGFGRTHRTNQKQPPEYILVTTDLRAQKRFVSSIARRLDQLGALTKGERKTASQGLFSAEDNLESQYSVDAQKLFWNDLYKKVVEGLDFGPLTELMGLDLIDPKTGSLGDSKLPTIQRFLNRLLALRVDLQAKVFDAFYTRMEELVEKAIENGTYDVGLETLHAIETKKVDEQVVYTDERTGATTRYVRLEQTKAVSDNPWEEVHERALAVRGAFSGFYRDNQTGQVFALINRGKRVTATGLVLTRGQRIEPVGAPRYVENVESIETGGDNRMVEREGPVFTGAIPEIEGLPYYAGSHFIRVFNEEGETGMRRMLEADYSADSYRAAARPAVEKLVEHVLANQTVGMAERRGKRYEKLGDADSVEAESAWRDAHVAAPKTRTDTVHMITGVILPIWDRFSADEKTRVARVQTGDGERLLGRVLNEESLGKVLKRLGVNTAGKLTPEQVEERVLSGQVATLVNGWILKKSRVSNEDRLELSRAVGQFTPGDVRLLRQMGAFTEQIQWNDRVFLPVGQPEVLGRVLASHPVAEFSGQGAPLFARRGDVSQPFYSELTAAVEASTQGAASAAQWMGMLRNRPGIKAEELDWVGVEDWLGEQDGAVSREALLAFVRANELVVTERVLGTVGDLPAETVESMREEQRMIVRQLAGMGYTLESTPEGPSLREGETDVSLYDIDDVPPAVRPLLDRYVVLDAEQGQAGYLSDEAAEQIESGKIAKFGTWVSEGPKTGYRELLIRLPTIRTFYENQHFTGDEEENIVAHVRFDERTDTDGKRVLFIEEIQSDWHQEGRRKGYTSPAIVARLEAEHAEIVKKYRSGDAEYEASLKRLSAARVAGASVPDAPFKTTWPALAMKRMIRWAAESGFERIAWTPGAEQIGRYRLSRKADQLEWVKYGGQARDGIGMVTSAAKIEANPVGELQGYDTEGIRIFSMPNMDAEALEKTIGADVARRLIEAPTESYNAPPRVVRRITNAGIDMTPQALPRFYDQELVYTANKIIKKYGGKVGRVVFDLSRRPRDQSFAEVSRMTEIEQMDAHGFDVTPALRDAAMAGQPLFRRPAAGAPAAGGMTAAAVEAVLGPAIAAVRSVVNISVVQSTADVGQAVPSDVEGVYFEGSNRVVLVADNLPDADTAARKFTHEVFGHLAAERHPAFREAIAGVLRLRRMGSKEIAELWRQVEQTHGYLDATTHAKEVIALLAERGSEAPLLDRLIAAIREFIRSLGIRLEFSVAELRDFVRAATKDLRAEATRRDLLKWHPEAERRLQSGDMGGLDEVYPTPLMDSQVEAESRLNGAERGGRQDLVGGLKAMLRRPDPAAEVELFDRLAGTGGAAAANLEGQLGLRPLYSRRVVPLPPGLEKIYQETMAEPGDELPIKDRARSFVQRIKAIDWLNLKQGVIDSYASVEALERGQFGAVLDASESAWKAALATHNHASVMAAVMVKGVPDYIDGALQFVAGRKGFFEIFGRITTHPDGNLMKHWKLWAAANRAERLMAEGRERNFTAEQIAEAKQLGEQYPEFAEVLADWIQMNRQALDLAEKLGVVDGRTRKIWERNDYVPFFRVFDEIEQGPRPKRGLAGQRSPVMRLHGGEAQVNDIMQNMVMNLSTLIDRSHKNVAMTRITGLADGIAMEKVPKPVRAKDYDVDDVARAFKRAGIDIGELGEAERDDYITLFHRVAPVGADIVSVMVKGKPVYYRVTDPLLLRSITALGADHSDAVLAIFQGAKRLLTAAVTADPAFMLANFIRDTLSNWVVSGASFHPFTGPIKGAKASLAGDDVLFKLMMAGGGGGGYYESQPEEIRKLLAHKLPAGEIGGFLKTVVTPRNAWRAWKRIGAAAENANRLAVFDSVIERGGSVAEAAYQARDVLNFTMHGDFRAMQVLTSTVPFMNARIQGLYRLYRGGRDNPRAFAMRGLLILAATVALMLRNQDEKEYEELQEWDKDAYWHIFVGGEHYRIPKPFEVGIMFATLPERLWRAGSGRDSSKILFKQIGAMIADTLAFNPVPQLVKPVLEQYANRNSFTGAPIVGAQERGLIPEAQYSAWTSETMRSLAEALPDFAPDWMRSPVRLQAALRAYLGSLGGYALGAADYATRNLGNYPEPAASTMYDLPVLRRFMRDPNPKTTKYAGEMYDMLDEANDIYRTMKVYRERGQIERAMEMLEEHRGKIMVRGRLNAMALQVRNINNQINLLQFSTLPPDVKRDRIAALQQRKNEVVGRVAAIADYF